MTLERSLFTLCIISVLQLQFAIAQDSNSSLNLKKERIVGGTEVPSIADFPYVVSLRLTKNFNGKHFCGGSIVHESWVLTAAHCLWYPAKYVDINKEDIIVVYAHRHLAPLEQARHQIGVCNLVLHPEWKQTIEKFKWDHDIALLQVNEPFTLSPEAAVIGLPNFNVPKYEINITCIVCGWGWTDPENNYEVDANTLQYSEVTLFDNTVCRNSYKEKFSKYRVCAGNLDQDKGVCHQDSGGPLVCHTHLVGVVSHIPLVCGRKGFPDRFTSVYEHNMWLGKIMYDYTCPKKATEYSNSNHDRNDTSESMNSTASQKSKLDFLSTALVTIALCATA